MPDISSVAICIPTFNQAQYLPESVGSACRQTYPNVEVWVSDDASTDATPEVMAELCQQFPQVRYYRQPKNLGIAANNNWVMSQPSTEFIVHLDSDDVLSSCYVETLLPLLKQYPQAGYAYSAVQEIDESSKERGVRRTARQQDFQSAERALRAVVYGCKLTANICIFRAKALQDVRFYEGSPEHIQDWYMLVKMADVGYGNVYLNEILAYYRIWTDAGNLRPKRKNVELRATIQLYEDGLLPAFQRRGWDTKLIDRNRRKLALIQAPYCYLPLLNEAERAELIASVKALGDSPALRFRLLALRWGFRPFFEWQYSSQAKLKSTIKDWLSWLQGFMQGLQQQKN